MGGVFYICAGSCPTDCYAERGIGSFVTEAYCAQNMGRSKGTGVAGGCGREIQFGKVGD